MIGPYCGVLYIWFGEIYPNIYKALGNNIIYAVGKMGSTCAPIFVSTL